MINANEFRLKNLVRYSINGEPMRIGEVSGLYITEDKERRLIIDYHYPASFGEPIPLSPEILKAAGFVQTNKYKNGYENNIGYSFYEYFKGYFVISEKDGEYRKYWYVDEDDFYSWHGVEVKYLHQIQNLYFALTGEELTITL